MKINNDKKVNSIQFADNFFNQYSNNNTKTNK